MNLLQRIAISLAAILCITALVACSSDAPSAPQQDEEKITTSSTSTDSTSAPSTTTATPSTTPLPETSPSPEFTPPETTPSPDIPTDYKNLLPSQIYPVLLSAQGYSISIQNGPENITYEKADNLLYCHVWNDLTDSDDEFYIDLSADGESLQSKLDALDLNEHTYWLNDANYNSFSAQQTTLTLSDQAMSEFNLALAQLSRYGTTYIYFVSDADGNSITATFTFEIPEIEWPN